jgi:predicted DNA-binding transcriptional regulator AlpA
VGHPVSQDFTLWTASEVAAYLRCGRSTVYRFMARADFPKAIRPGNGHPRWLKVEVEAWAVRQKFPAAA